MIESGLFFPFDGATITKNFENEHIISLTNSECKRIDKSCFQTTHRSCPTKQQQTVHVCWFVQDISCECPQADSGQEYSFVL